MDAYVYKAALLCEDCARKELRKRGFKRGETLRIQIWDDKKNRLVSADADSDDLPQGPYADGGGEP